MTTSLRFAALAAALLALPLAVACSATSPDAVSEEEAPVITGQKDTGHPAVMALTMTSPGAMAGAKSYAGCTGTMVAVNTTTKIGYVLTAAHCVKDAITISVTQGSDKTESSTLLGFAFLDYTAHPSYDGQVSSPYDVAMIRVLGVDANTPVIPMLAPDNMVQGSTRVTSVGWGQTMRPNITTDAGSNTAKNRIDGTIASLSTTAVGVRYDNSGDICHGDSGGPVLTTVNGKEYVAAVHSYVTGPCVGVGYSVRASAHKAFFETIIGNAAPAETCESCRKIAGSGTNVCAEARRACVGDAQCNGLRTCITKCSAAATDAGSDAGASDECKKACSVEFPFGAAPYNTEIIFCSCNACASACSGETTCAALPACGMNTETTGPTATTPTPEACNTCMNGGCCAEQEACGKDGHCYRCLRTPETPGCAADALYTKIKACQARSCSGQCQ